MKTSDQQSVLVTGASGFIGLHLVRLLVARGRSVSCFVRPTSHVKELLAAGAELVTGDVTDRAGISRAIALSNARVVFPLAGLVRALSPGDFMRVNAEGVEAIAAACTEQAERPVLLLVSSLAAAGPSAAAPKMESDPPVPVSDYGRSKFAGEQAAARHAGALPITIVRPCAVFGAGDRGMYE
ncbi:MAG TPA: NAD-dependent epimerase/dehydratase family protein, partial [Longimicrobiales bacterium]|nr:NAD-dependent epimerase/dehydratase family protein [Longimicrobiales bacterium]